MPTLESYEAEKYVKYTMLFIARDEEAAFEKLAWSVSDIEAVWLCGFEDHIVGKPT